jgi:hypothetical protein
MSEDETKKMSGQQLLELILARVELTERIEDLESRPS